MAPFAGLSGRGEQNAVHREASVSQTPRLGDERHEQRDSKRENENSSPRLLQAPGPAAIVGGEEQCGVAIEAMGLKLAGIESSTGVMVASARYYTEQVPQVTRDRLPPWIKDARSR